MTAATFSIEDLPEILYRSEAFAEDLDPQIEASGDSEAAWFSVLWFTLPLAVALLGTASTLIA